MKRSYIFGSKKVGNLLLLVLVVLVAAALFANKADSATQPGIPLDLQVISSAKPGGLKVGSIVTITVIIRNIGLAKIPKLEVGILGLKPPMNPSQKLSKPTKELSVWNAGPLAKGQTKKLEFKLTVQVPPGAKGPGLWCVNVLASPSLLKGSPPWSKTEEDCYLIFVP